MLQDLLVNNLKLVVCGTAASSESARRSHYYAGKGNKFWRTLFQAGFTDVELAPAEYRKLLTFGIGLTDVVKNQSGMDVDIDFKKAEIAGLKQKLLQYKPQAVCFNGKKAAQTFFMRKQIAYGLQAESLGPIRLYVAPSTSGAANGFWDIQHWQRLFELLNQPGF